MKVFFVKYNDPIYVKLEKLDIMIRLASQANIAQVSSRCTENVLSGTKATGYGVWKKAFPTLGLLFTVYLMKQVLARNVRLYEQTLWDQTDTVNGAHVFHAGTP